MWGEGADRRTVDRREFESDRRGDVPARFGLTLLALRQRSGSILRRLLPNPKPERVECLGVQPCWYAGMHRAKGARDAMQRDVRSSRIGVPRPLSLTLRRDLRLRKGANLTTARCVRWHLARHGAAPLFESIIESHCHGNPYAWLGSTDLCSGRSVRWYIRLRAPERHPERRLGERRVGAGNIVISRCARRGVRPGNQCRRCLSMPSARQGAGDLSEFRTRAWPMPSPGPHSTLSSSRRTLRCAPTSQLCAPRARQSQDPDAGVVRSASAVAGRQADGACLTGTLGVGAQTR